MRLSQSSVGEDSRMWLSPDAEEFIESGGLELNRGPELVGVYCKVPAYANPKDIRKEIEKRLSEKINRSGGSQLAGVYIDKAPTEGRVKSRKYYERMIQDCKEGKLTYLIVPSVACFSRHIRAALFTVRMLKQLPRPVHVLFLKEKINTSGSGNTIALELIASIELCAENFK